MKPLYKTLIGTALVAAAQLAAADTAEVTLSNFTISVSGGEWWYWAPSNVDWLSPNAGTSVALNNPSLADASTVWHGNAASSSVTDGSSLSLATLSSTSSWDFNGVTATAKVVAENGQSGWAFANVFDGQLMVGGNATITISATVNQLSASGSSAQANAYIEVCSTDFVTDTCDNANFVEAVADGNSGAFGGPYIISTSWTNPGATAWTKLHIGLTASADSAVTAVPEPTSAAMLLAGLAGIGAIARRRRAA